MVDGQRLTGQRRGRSQDWIADQGADADAVGGLSGQRQHAPAREGQAAHKPVADGLGWIEVGAGALLAFVLVAPFGRLALLAAVVSIAVVALAGLYFRAQLGGITGDTLGAANQIVELACYLVCAGAQRWI